MESSPRVSILCTAYNHEAFIADALESFIKQETDFSFEVIVHDDASTDKTAEIIKNYVDKYPDIIHPIFQKQNQYSQGIDVMKLCLNEARGKYIALCEGDDYWIDSKKLQMQFDVMESHSDATFCFGNAYRLCSKTGDNLGDMLSNTGLPTHNDGQTYGLTLQEVDAIEFIPTATFFMPKNILTSMPVLANDAFQGDRYIQLVCAALGKSYYVDSVMSAYRINVVGSVTDKWRSNFQLMTKVRYSYIRMYEEFNRVTDDKYNEDLRLGLLHQKYLYMFLIGKKSVLSLSDSLNVAKKFGNRAIMKLLFFRISPRFYMFLKRHKKFVSV